MGAITPKQFMTFCVRDGPDGYEPFWRLEGAILDINDVLIVFIIQKRVLNDEPAKKIHCPVKAIVNSTLASVDKRG